MKMMTSFFIVVTSLRHKETEHARYNTNNGGYNSERESGMQVTGREEVIHLDVCGEDDRSKNYKYTWKKTQKSVQITRIGLR